MRDSVPPDDPTCVDPATLRDWPREVAGRYTANLRPAGVLIPLLERPGGLTMLLTRRSRALKHHAGQVSFPGGRMEADDADIRATALRETHEEIGVEPGRVDITGYLSPLATITGYAVTPVVGLVDDAIRLTLDPVEVERAFEVPLDFLFEARNVRGGMRQVGEVEVPVVEFAYAGERIWGATASMIVTLRDILI